MSFPRAALLTLLAGLPAFAQAEPVKVKVFVGSMFEIGETSGDRAGEFQYWFEDYWADAAPVEVAGAAHPVWCNDDGVCGAVLGMGKVASSASMMAILLNPEFDFSQAYYLLTGVAGTPPSRGTIGSVFWGSWLVDYDLGHRWAEGEVPDGDPLFMPRKGYEEVRLFQLDPALTAKALDLSSAVPLVDSEDAKSYRMRYPDPAAQAAPSVGVGTHMTGDTFFHGPGLSDEAQYIATLYEADDYVITEMEAAALAQVIGRLHGTGRILSLRGAVNFDQGNPDETTLAHLDPAPGETAGGFDETLQNIHAVGAAVVDDMVANWDVWAKGTPAP